ncbi:FecR domain-containing protein [Sphingobium sp. CECT 9361]|uniref:FecR family protein n=1 Tax=Sphingobium sp. CECT 9361 TaxID=2845384 RepID=UPI001E2AACBD|nr:FecR domain-containing protein [Sphingobium sp. CECT 9361]CAH0354787.1 hypothetical protein SPH9361_03159 [Sphingobium sp. CECT 9361]
MQQDDAMIEEAALGWIVRLQDPDFDDWDGFEAWLSASPLHAGTYHAMATAEADVAALLASAPAPLASPAPATARRARRYWLGGAVAASLVAVLGIGFVANRPAPYSVETQPGVRRTITLADGSAIVMNGGTRLTLDRKDSRFAMLDRGEAMFVVRHDTEHPFAVHVGDAKLIDVGTAFAVVREAGVTQVAVSEGAVVYNPQTEAIRLDAGRRLRAVDGAMQVETGAVAPETVASWQSGRLIYGGQPLSAVVADLARYYGQPVSVAPAIANRPFHGVIVLPKHVDIEAIARLLDVRAERQSSGWMMLPKR